MGVASSIGYAVAVPRSWSRRADPLVAEPRSIFHITNDERFQKGSPR